MAEIFYNAYVNIYELLKLIEDLKKIIYSNN